MKSKKLFIIAGATGELGTEYIKLLSKDHKILSISRKTAPAVTGKNISHLYFDLTSYDEVNQNLDKVDLSDYSEIVFLHSIGIDKFEMQQFPAIRPLETIDPEVYNSNVNTYKFIERYLIQKISDLRKVGAKTKLKLIIIASVADKHNVIFLTSFSESKNIVRSYMRNAVGNYEEWVSALVINISSMVTKTGLMTRPYAETKYFLTPKELATKSLSKMLESCSGYHELEVIKPDPDFNADYYRSNEKIFLRWKKFVYGN